MTILEYGSRGGNPPDLASGSAQKAEKAQIYSHNNTNSLKNRQDCLFGSFAYLDSLPFEQAFFAEVRESRRLGLDLKQYKSLRQQFSSLARRAAA